MGNIPQLSIEDERFQRILFEVWNRLPVHVKNTLAKNVKAIAESSDNHDMKRYACWNTSGPVTDGVVLIYSKDCQSLSDESIAGCFVHELGHAYKTVDDPNDLNAIEKAGDEMPIKWGFDKEISSIKRQRAKDMHSSIIVPAFNKTIGFLALISPLTILRRMGEVCNNYCLWSPRATEIYVIVWLVISSLIWLLCYSYGLLAFISCALIAILLIWRLLDISQAWLNTYKDREVHSRSPVRSLILVFLNYLELTLIFGILAFVCRYDFYPAFDNAIQSLRYSIGVITLLGSKYDPGTWLGGIIYYSEFIYGLVFLVIVINRVLALSQESSS